MALEKAIRLYTKEQTTATAVNRVYAMGEVPPQTARPYIEFAVASSLPSHSCGGDSGYTHTRIQFTVTGDNRDEVKPVIQALKTAYRNYLSGSSSMLMSSEHWVQATLLAGEMDIRPDDAGLRRSILDVIFAHKE